MQHHQLHQYQQHVSMYFNNYYIIYNVIVIIGVVIGIGIVCEVIIVIITTFGCILYYMKRSELI